MAENACIAELYKWGGLDEGSVHSRARPCAWSEGASDHATVLMQAAAFLRDLPVAWGAAASERRLALAHLVFSTVEMQDDQVAGFVVQPEVAPFVVAREEVGARRNGHDNATAWSVPANEVLKGRKRWGSVRRASAVPATVFNQRSSILPPPPPFSTDWTYFGTAHVQRRRADLVSHP